MKALRLHAAGELRLHEEPDPEPQPGEVLVRVGGVGLCGSDRHWFLEGGIGDAVLERAARPRSRVRRRGGEWPSARRARRARPGGPLRPLRRSASPGTATSAPSVRFAGHGSTDGGLRTLVAWPEHLVHPASGLDLGRGGPAARAARRRAARRRSRRSRTGDDRRRLRLRADRAAARTGAAGRRRHGRARSRPAPAPCGCRPRARGAPLRSGRRDGRRRLRGGGRRRGARRRDRGGAPRRPRRARRHPRRRPEYVPRRRGTTQGADARLVPPHAGGRPPAGDSTRPSPAGSSSASLVSARYPLDEGAQAFRDLVDRRGLKVVVEP